MKPTRRHTLQAVLAAAVMIGMAAAPPADAQTKKTFTFGVARAIPTLDPYRTPARDATLVVAPLMFDTLIWRDPQSGDFKPLLATEWRWMDDTTLEMKLRQGVKFHDGSVFDADDVVYTINFAVNPQSQIAQPSSANWLKSAEKVDQYTVRLKLNGPFGPALEYLSSLIPMVREGHYEGPEKDKLIGTGPYTNSRYVPGTSASFTLNKDYFKESPKAGATIETINLRLFSDANSQLAEFLSRNLDWIWQMPPDQAERLSRMGSTVTVEYGNTLRTRWLLFNSAGITPDHPLKDRRVRQAINHAINKEKMRMALASPGAENIEALCYKSQFGCVEPKVTYAYDPAKAKALLAEAGYPNGFEVELYATRERTWTEAIMSDLAAVGIRAQARMVQLPTIQQKSRNHEIAMIDSSWGSNGISDTTAAFDLLEYYGPSGKGLTGDEELVGWLEAARVTTDRDKRLQIFRQIIDRFAEQAYAVPMSTVSTAYAYQKGLSFQPWPDEVPRFYMTHWK